jgi:hypothetical protein
MSVKTVSLFCAGLLGLSLAVTPALATPGVSSRNLDKLPAGNYVLDKTHTNLIEVEFTKTPYEKLKASGAQYQVSFYRLGCIYHGSRPSCYPKLNAISDYPGLAHG